MNVGLCEAMLGRMEALRANIAATSTTADELARSAHLLDGEPVAQALRERAQWQRVKILEMQGRLAALRERYDARPRPEA